MEREHFQVGQHFRVRDAYGSDFPVKENLILQKASLKGGGTVFWAPGDPPQAMVPSGLGRAFSPWQCSSERPVHADLGQGDALCAVAAAFLIQDEELGGLVRPAHATLQGCQR